ncbi:MAG: cation:proton antiporter [Candidatus Heimdallarchaeota archaeon]
MNPNALVDIGLVIAAAYVVSKIFQKAGIPQVVGIMLVGVVLGKSGLNLITGEMLGSLQPMIDLALGFIGFNIGRALNISLLRRGGSKLFIILIFETIAAFTLVLGGFYLYTKDLPTAILFGALAAATAPAATADVIWEYRAQGILTQTLLFILALDDIIGVILTRLAIAYTEAHLTAGVISFSQIALLAIIEIGGSLILGVVLGWLVANVVRLKHTNSEIIVLAAASVLLCTGVAEAWDLSPILANITFGATLANLSAEANTLFTQMEDSASPFYVIFFILIGARLDLSIISSVLGISMLYVILRSIGKFGGVFVGGRLGKHEPTVQKNLGFCLWSQAGVTLGLAMMIATEFPALGPAGQELAMMIVSVITVSTFIVQIIGPYGVKLAITRAGEIGKDYSRPMHAPHKPVRVPTEVVSPIIDQEITHVD